MYAESIKNSGLPIVYEGLPLLLRGATEGLPIITRGYQGATLSTTKTTRISTTINQLISQVPFSIEGSRKVAPR